ncbi:MAG: hypothetical protein AVDCRST_MAG15-2034, partial [uncultured Rubellimicrobium sp.]
RPISPAAASNPAAPPASWSARRS